MGLLGRLGTACAALVALVSVALGTVLSLYNFDHLDGPVHGRLAWVLHKPNFLLGDIPDLRGKTAIVVGATHGIGYWTALHLALKGASVVLGCRDMTACRAVEATISEKARTSGGGAVAAHIDLAERATIRTFAETFRGMSSELHMLILNAALTSPVYRNTSDGHELTLAVNWIGGFYLQHLLQGLLDATGTPDAPARLVIVASNAHTSLTDADVTDADFGLIATPARAAAYSAARMFPTYARSKLLNILHARVCAQRSETAAIAAGHAGRPRVVTLSLSESRCQGATLSLETSFASILAVPGFIRTNIASGPVDAVVPAAWAPLVKAAVQVAFSLAGAMDEESGAITTLYAATAPEAAALNGAYLVPFGRRWAGTAQAQDAALAERAWAVAEDAIAGWPRV